MFKWAADTEAIERAAVEAGCTPPRSPTKADAARAIYFGSPMPTPPRSSELKPTLSFFAAVAAALALGAQVNKDNGANEDNDMVVDDFSLTGRPPSRKGLGRKPKSAKSSLNLDARYAKSPTMLFALSEQALDIFDKSHPYDLDYLIALIMQALYMLHDGQPVVDRQLYPLVCNLFYSSIRCRLVANVFFVNFFLGRQNGQHCEDDGSQHGPR